MLILTTFDLDDYVSTRCAPGPAASCSRTRPPPSSSHAVRVVAAGEALLAPSVTRRLIDTSPQRAAGPARSRPLAGSPPGGEVLRLIGRGRSNREIAEDLVVAGRR